MTTENQIKALQTNEKSNKKEEKEDVTISLNLSFKLPGNLNEQQMSNLLTDNFKNMKRQILKKIKKEKNIKIEELESKIEEKEKKQISSEIKLFSDPQKKNFLRFVHISDTHNKTNSEKFKVPEGDVLLHTGDFTLKGTKEEVFEFNEWLGTLPHKYKILICGNHVRIFLH